MDLSNLQDVENLLERVDFDVFVNLAGPSSVKESLLNPSLTYDSIIKPVKTFLSIASQKNRLNFHFVQASTSEIYGGLNQELITEDQLPHPVNPYAVAKLEVSKILKELSANSELLVSNLIMFNHESPLREEKFISQKIVRGLVQVKMGKLDSINVGDLRQSRDWSFAGDFMNAVAAIIVKKSIGDYILASGKLHSIYEIAQIAHKYLKIEKQLDEIINVDQRELRSVEPGAISGDSSKAQEQIDWCPRIGFEQLIKMLVDAEISRVNLDIYPTGQISI